MRRLGKLWERMLATVRNEPVDLDFQAEMAEHVGRAVALDPLTFGAAPILLVAVALPAS